MLYAILDIEATGGERSEESIIEIAILLYDGSHLRDTFSSLVNPKKKILPYVEKLTGINQELLRGAFEFKDIAIQVLEITQNACIVGHGVAFDYYVLRLEFSRLGINFHRETIDTLTLSKKYFPSAASYSLGKLCSWLKISLLNRHRALGDAQATLKLFELLLEKQNA